MKTVLITGGAGWMAPFVAEAFEITGEWMVYVTDCKDGRYVDLLADLTSKHDCAKLFEQVKPDVICHLAAQGNVYAADQYPADALRAGPLATCELLDAVCARCPQARVILASTWEVYGQPVLWEPVTEMHPRTPESFYALAKNQQEEVARTFVERRGSDVVTLRLGSAYGPRMRGASVFSIFIDRASKGMPLTVFGEDGFRQWTHVRDIARAFLLTATKPEAVGVYNAVCDEPISTIRLATDVNRLFVGDNGTPLPITVAERREGEVTPAIVSSDRLMELGWFPLEEWGASLAEIVTERGKETR